MGREDLLNKEYRVLDKGFIKLIDYMGSDERIVQAARISYRGESIKR
ncbi:thymidylate synthase (FAD), partial (plasmid) [Borrelia miyamotoi]